MHEGAVSTRLGLRGWPRVAEDVIVARDVLLAEYDGRALPRRARLDARRRAHPARGQVARHRRHRRGHAAPPAAHRRGAARLRHRLQGEPAAARARTTSTRCARRSPTAPSTPSPPTTRRTRRSRRTASSPRRSPGMIGLELCFAAAARAGRRSGALTLGAPRRRALARARRASSASSRRRCARARCAELVLVDPERALDGRAGARCARRAATRRSSSASCSGAVALTLSPRRRRVRRASEAAS